MNGKTISPINITSKIMKGILVVVFCRCIKGKLYVTCVRSAMIYERETWAVTAGQSGRWGRTEVRMVRWMCGVSLRDRVQR